MTVDRAEPRIFLCFDGDDRPAAKYLRESLLTLDATPFLDQHDIRWSENLFNAINKALTDSAYLVLLWSWTTIGNTYVEAEYTAALMSTLDGRRPFLFVVKLDDAPLPPLLAPRKYLEFTGDWDSVASEIMAEWQRDRAVGLPVLAAPFPSTDTSATIAVYVRNDGLSVAHRVPVAPNLTGKQLMTAVRAALGLKDGVTAFAGQVGARFQYRMEHDGRQVTDNGRITAMGITDGSELTLRVTVEWFGPGRTTASEAFRDEGRRNLSAAARRHLLELAFAHLMPPRDTY